MIIVPLIPYLLFQCIWYALIAFIVWYFVLPVVGVFLGIVVFLLLIVPVAKWLDKKEAKKKAAIMEAKAAKIREEEKAKNKIIMDKRIEKETETWNSLG